jgi:DNA-binding transcriptional MerR regulator
MSDVRMNDKKEGDCVVSEWLTVTQLEKETGIPTPTIRRYIRQHGFYLLMKKKHKSYLIARESIDTLHHIRDMYGQGMNVEQVNESLIATGATMTITMNDEDGVTSVQVGEVLSELKGMMFEQMTIMAGEIHKLRQEVAATKQIDEQTERQKRVNDIITQRTVEAQLRREALKLWEQKPERERMRKTFLWFKEEDTDKRERFIRDYVDEHFSARMKDEFSLE